MGCNSESSGYGAYLDYEGCSARTDVVYPSLHGWRAAAGTLDDRRASSFKEKNILTWHLHIHFM